MTLLTTLNMLSVNQLNSQLKLLEMWKATKISGYPFKPQVIMRYESVPYTRAGRRIEGAVTNNI